MAKLRRLHQHIGEVVMIIEPDAYACAAITASDNDGGAAVAGMAGVLFVMQLGDHSGVTFNASIAYSSTGNASDASTSTTVWASSDAVIPMTGVADSDTENSIYLLDLDIACKGFSDAAGKLFATCTPSGGTDFALLAIPYPATTTLPCTNENAVEIAD